MHTEAQGGFVKVHKMTRWDEGQVLIKAHDCLMECAKELKETLPKYSHNLEKMALTIGTLFNSLGSHEFGLRDLTELEAPERKGKR